MDKVNDWNGELREEKRGVFYEGEESVVIEARAFRVDHSQCWIGQ